MKKYPFVNRYVELSEKLMHLAPDWITGRSDIMKQKYYKKYGARDYSQSIRRNKTNTMSAYLCIAAIFLILILCCTLLKPVGNCELTSIPRPVEGQTAKSVPLEVQMSYKDVVLTKDITLRIEQKAMTDMEKLALIRDFKKRLGGLILGENKDLNHIVKPLALMDRDPETGITIDWTSDDPELVSEDGEVNLINVDRTRTVLLKADLTLDNTEETGVYKVKIDPKPSEEDYQRSLTLTLRGGLASLGENTFSESLALPGEMGDGVEVRWFSGKGKKGAALLPAFLLTMLIVYFKRYDRIDREIKAAELSVNRDLPEFINKLVLLLNAGLVFSTAFSKIMSDYESFYCGGKTKQNEKKFLYEEMLEIQKRVDQSNASLIRELKEFSQRCGVREMIRVTAVISDNWNKGSALAEKLEAESGLLWISRKKRAEEKGKLAETKLTFPLVILLLVLIMVTIAPAMLEM